MKRFKLPVLALIGLIVVLAAALSRSHSGSDSSENAATYSIALTLLPDRLQPWANPVNVFGLILDAVYFPLLSTDVTSGEIHSEFLDTVRTKATSSDLKHYSFCLKQNVRYSDGTPIEGGDLAAMLTSFHSTQILAEPSPIIQLHGNCVTVTLKSADPIYFERFGGSASTILKQSTIHARIPTGLGSYSVYKFGESEIILKRNQIDRSSIQTLKFLKVRDAASALDAHIDDLNYIYQGKLPDAYLHGKLVISRPAMKTYGLIVRTARPQDRVEFARCFPRTEYAKVTALNLKPVDGVLPEGVLGSKQKFEQSVGVPAPRECVFRNANKPSVDFLSYNPTRDSEVRAFFAKYAVALPVKVNVVSVSALDFTKRLMDTSSPMVALVGLDSSGSSSAAFGEAATYLEPFLNRTNTSIVNFEIEGLRELIRSAASETSSERKMLLYSKAHDLVMATGVVVPLGQLVTDHYFPNWISNLVWADPTSEFPLLDKLVVL